MRSWRACLIFACRTCYRTSWFPEISQIDAPSSAHRSAESIDAYWRGWYSDPGNFVLDPIGESFVELVSEGSQVTRAARRLKSTRYFTIR